VAALEKYKLAFVKLGVRKTRRVAVPLASEADWFEPFGEKHPRLTRLGIAGFTREAANWRHDLLSKRWRD
jgi:hypothetical protein